LSRYMVMRNSFAAIRFGAFYATLVFLVGFALGTLRVLVIAPEVGDLAAVLIELPVILGLSWLVFRMLAKISESARTLPRGLISLCAFLVLIGLEFVLAAMVFSGGASAFLASWLTLTGAIGLSGQVAFALIPLIYWRVTN